MPHDRSARLRLLAGSALGVGCLLSPSGSRPGRHVAVRRTFRSGRVDSGDLRHRRRLARAGAVVVRRHDAHRGRPCRVAGDPDRDDARLVCPGRSGHPRCRPKQARVTTGGIVAATTAATAAVCLGVALGLLRRPADPRLRFLLAAVVGGVCAQTVIWLSMRLWTYDVNYEHIRRLDWLIVLACALLTAVGMHSRPELPSVRTARNMRKILVSLVVIAITAVALLVTGARWSPAQRMPSAFSVEQLPAPAGADVALALTAIGPEGSGLIRRAVFAASDDTGRPVRCPYAALMADGTADRATLLVVVHPRSSRPELCGAKQIGAAAPQAAPMKLTMRDEPPACCPGRHPGRVVRPMTATRPQKLRGLLGNSIALLA